ncbi:MAG: addiction module protein [Planctomycetes bacterium]|nr:addiction module protein [Planctomycetota bacterium]
MSEQTARLLEQALLLPPLERAELVELLQSSLDSASAEEITASHLKEVRARAEALDRGEFKTVSTAEAFEMARRKR